MAKFLSHLLIPFKAHSTVNVSLQHQQQLNPGNITTGNLIGVVNHVFTVLLKGTYSSDIFRDTIIWQIQLQTITVDM